MANISKKVSQNVGGPVYVDWSCLYCELCVMTAPTIFAENEEDGWAYVKKQPTTDLEWKQVMQAIAECPLDSIGSLPRQ